MGFDPRRASPLISDHFANVATRPPVNFSRCRHADAAAGWGLPSGITDIETRSDSRP